MNDRWLIEQIYYATHFSWAKPYKMQEQIRYFKTVFGVRFELW